MRQRNHCSSSKGIPKMKLRASEPSGPESLQSQTRPWPKKRLSISRLGVVHRRLLYIEHDDDNLYMLKMRLERVGDFEVLAADDSEKGCKLALTERPDVILMDLEMPVVDRWEPVRTLKNAPQARDIPIIGMSAYAQARGPEQ